MFMNQPATIGVGRFSCLTALVALMFVGAMFASPLKSQTSVTPNQKPNIVFILADDLGWSDTTLFGTTKLYETPNIERLAERGMTFTKAYSSSPLCSPTRCSILTGLSPARTGLTAPIAHLPKVVLAATPGVKAGATKKSVPVNSVTRLDPKYYTISERLKDEGYATGHFGKWHLGKTPYSPLENGFDVDVPHWPGPGPAGGFVAPWRYPDFDPDTPNQHIEDRMAEEAKAFMSDHADQPFFLNYWMFSVHAPFDGKPDLIEKYRTKIADGDPQAVQRCPTYAAMIHSMDDAVGALIDEIDRLGIADNTIIIFASDNGGNMYNWVDQTLPTSNAPLRGGKASMYEGGVRGPCTIVWPGETAVASRSDQPIQSCDFYPTILEMLSLEPRPEQSFDGISIAPTLRGVEQQREEIFTYFPHSPNIPDWLPPAVSVVKGDWKLIRLFQNGESGQHRWKLFNLANDIGETNDLAKENPAMVTKLDGLIDKFLIDTQAVTPTANPNFNPAKYRVEDEGKAEPHGKNKKPKRKKKKPKGGTAAMDWRSTKEGRTSLAQRRLVGNCLRSNTLVTAELMAPVRQGDSEVKIETASEGSSAGSLFWHPRDRNPQYEVGHKTNFDITSDGRVVTDAMASNVKREVGDVSWDRSTPRGTVGIAKTGFPFYPGQVLKNGVLSPANPSGWLTI